MDSIELNSTCSFGRDPSRAGFTQNGDWFCPASVVVKPKKYVVQSAYVEDEHNLTLSNWQAYPLRGPDYWNARFMYSRPENPRQTEALVTAAARGDLERVAELLAAGAWPNHCDANGGTPLHFAAYYGHAEVVRLLVEGHADPGARMNARELTEISYVIRRTTARETGDTPLHLAAMNGHEEVARILLESGADSKARNAQSQTPYDLARARGLDAVISTLDAAQATKGQGTGSPQTPVKAACDRHAMSFSLASATTATPDSTMWSEAALEGKQFGGSSLTSDASTMLHTDGPQGVLRQAGLGNCGDIALLVLVVDMQRTRAMDASGLSESFAVGTCPSLDKAAISAELVRMAAILTNTGVNYKCILLTGSVSERLAPSPNSKDGFVDLKVAAQDMPQDAPARALCQSLQGAFPRARLLCELPPSVNKRPGVGDAGDAISAGLHTCEPDLCVRVKHRRRCAAGHKLISEQNEFYGIGILCDGCQVRICSANVHRCKRCSFNLCDGCYGRADVGQATEHCHPGQMYEAIHQLIMRAGEDLSSRPLGKIPMGSRLNVLQIGVGAAGKRIRVSDDEGHVGWVSVVDSCNRPLVQLLEVAPPTGS